MTEHERKQAQYELFAEAIRDVVTRERQQYPDVSDDVALTALVDMVAMAAVMLNADYNTIEARLAQTFAIAKRRA